MNQIENPAQPGNAAPVTASPRERIRALKAENARLTEQHVGLGRVDVTIRNQILANLAEIRTLETRR